MSLIAAFLEVLCMPHLEHLAISVDLWEMADSEAECTKLLSGCSYDLLPIYLTDPQARPSLLKYNLTKNAEWEDPPEPFPMVFTIPLDRFPTISSMSISAGVQVYFVRGFEEVTPWNLREIRFSGCMYLDIGYFQWAVKSLRDVWAWDTMERVILENCCSLDYNEVLEVVGQERLHYST